MHDDLIVGRSSTYDGGHQGGNNNNFHEYHCSATPDLHIFDLAHSVFELQKVSRLSTLHATIYNSSIMCKYSIRAGEQFKNSRI